MIAFPGTASMGAPFRAAVRRLHALHCFAWALVLLAPADGTAQVHAIRWFSSDDGLPHDFVISIVQDRTGYLWLGTWNGVTRFDGHAFRNFHSIERGLSHKTCRSMCLDSTGTGVWWVAQEAGVFHIDRAGRMTELRRMRDGVLERLQSIRTVTMDEGHRLWFAGAEGLHSLDARGGWRDAGASTGQAVGSCTRGVWKRSSGELWCVSGLREVSIYSPRSGTVRRLDIATLIPTAARRRRGNNDDLIVNCIVPNPATGGVWIVTNGWVFPVEGNPSAIRAFPLPDIGGHVYFTPTTDGNGNVWIVRTRKNDISYEYCKISLRDGSVLASIGRDPDFATMLPFGTVFEDREGVVWIGGQGLGQVRSMQVVNYRLAWEGMPNVPRNLVELDDGTLLLSTWGGVYRVNGRSIEAPEYLSLQSGYPGVATSFITMDGRGIPHWAQFAKGTFVYRNGRAQPDRPHPAASGRGRAIPTLENSIVLRDGTLAGCSFAVGDSLVFVTDSACVSVAVPGLDPAREHLEYFAMAAPRGFPGNDNALLVLSNSALYEFSGTRFVRRITDHPGFRIGRTPQMCVDSAGTVWIAYLEPADQRVLYRYDGRAFTGYTAASLGLQNASISSISAHHNRADLLIGTFNGLSITTLATMRTRRQLGVVHGLASNVINGARSDRNGAIWLLTASGLSRFSEAGSSFRRDPSSAVLTRVVCNDDEIAIPPGDRDGSRTMAGDRIEFQYSALSYRTPLLFRTMLEGDRSEWSSPSARTSIRYTNLDPGDYTFRVRAIDPESAWESVPVAFAFTVPPPFYRTWWFVVGGNLVFIAVLLLVLRVRVKNIERIQQLRGRIALDIHDEIGSTLTSISFLSAMAESETRDTLPSTSVKIRRIGDTARGVVEMMSDIIWSLRPEHDSFADLRQRLSDAATELAESSGVRIRVDVADDLGQRQLRMDYRRNLFLIAKEAMHNAVRHADASEIALLFSKSGKTAVLEVRDNGAGMHAPSATGTGSGTGMNSMRRRAAEMGGTIAFLSPGDGGCVVRVTIPM
ncbi:MAG: hypothetical protein IPP94_18965 [Ignavibacteria bacterium]|nr:hypothetical protein [Ignavibacteria bacterium]